MADIVVESFVSSPPHVMRRVCSFARGGCVAPDSSLPCLRERPPLIRAMEGNAMLRRRRLRRAASKLKWHLDKMDQLMSLRRGYENEIPSSSDEYGVHLMAMALAVNYELASHASRAIGLLRQVDELRPSDQMMDLESIRIRDLLNRCSALPAIPRREVGWHSAEHVEELYDQYYLLSETGIDFR